MARFRYLGFIIPISIIEIICIFFAFRYYNNIKKEKEAAEYDERVSISDRKITSESYNTVLIYSFERVYLGYGKKEWTTKLLCFTRFICFFYFMGIAFIYNFARVHEGETKPTPELSIQYFTNWNIILVSIYYMLAFSSSCIGIKYGSGYSDDNGLGSIERSDWDKKVILLGKIQNIIFEVEGATALLVTIVSFGLLDHSLDFWNITPHLFQTISFLIEMSLNRLHVNFEHAPINLFWAGLYCCFVWPLVATGVMEKWPYFFFHTDTAACFIWYNGLFIADIGFYSMWYGLSYIKYKHTIDTDMNYKSIKSLTLNEQNNFEEIELTTTMVRQSNNDIETGDEIVNEDEEVEIPKGQNLLPIETDEIDDSVI